MDKLSPCALIACSLLLGGLLTHLCSSLYARLSRRTTRTVCIHPIQPATQAVRVQPRPPVPVLTARPLYDAMLENIGPYRVDHAAPDPGKNDPDMVVRFAEYLKYLNSRGYDDFDLPGDTRAGI